MQRNHSATKNETRREQAQQAADAALAAAEKAAEAAGRAARTAAEWAAPRAEQAYHTAARKAAPYARKAGVKAEHWADVAHGAIVGAAIPAIVAAFERAANEPEEEEVPIVAKRNNTWAKVLVPVLIAGAAGAALVIWARRDPGRDAWAGDDDEWDFGGEADFQARLRRDVNRAVDATTAAAKKAATVVAAAAETVAEEASPYVEKATAAAKEEAEKLRDSLAAARSRAAHGIADTFDDAEDVWEDEGGPAEDAPAPAAAKKPRSPRKPASPKE